MKERQSLSDVVFQLAWHVELVSVGREVPFFQPSLKGDVLHSSQKEHAMAWKGIHQRVVCLVIRQLLAAGVGDSGRAVASA